MFLAVTIIVVMMIMIVIITIIVMCNDYLYYYPLLLSASILISIYFYLVLTDVYYLFILVTYDFRFLWSCHSLEVPRQVAEPVPTDHWQRGAAAFGAALAVQASWASRASRASRTLTRRVHHSASLRQWHCGSMLRVKLRRLERRKAGKSALKMRQAP